MSQSGIPLTGGSNQIEDMDEKLWYEEMPELLQREKKILESKGFQLNQYKYITEKIVEFVGQSSVIKEYPLRIIYPNGYPSFPPTVISNVIDDLVLVRHQTKLNKVLCLFGFSSERWRASFTAKEVLQEAEELLINFSPLSYSHDDEDNKGYFVPEPIINQYDYTSEGILIPSPFGDVPLDMLEAVNIGTLKFPSNKSGRGILNSIKILGEDKKIDNGYEKWFEKATIYSTKVYKMDSPPPLTTSNILSWLKENNIPFNTKKNQFIFFVFDDEWGEKGNTRISWLALKLTGGKASWVRCYLISDDDIMIRTPNGRKFYEKKVTIVGAGSLGSIVSTTLAQEGIGTIYLVDYDIYEPSNAIRHQVRQSFFALSKVDGVAERILELSPKTNVKVSRMSVGSTKEHESTKKFMEILNESDIVIDTTGEHGVSHFLNRLCVKHKIPLVIGSVTNGAWSCEIVKYIPNHSGCWGCWNRNYGKRCPPSAPKGKMQFAPGCDQPTFIGGISSINIAGGLVAEAGIDTLLMSDLESKHYIVWSEREHNGNRQYSVEYLKNPAFEDCDVCSVD